MSAAAVGAHMPAVISLDDLAAINDADPYGHRYETSPEGVLSVMPPRDLEHARIASRLMAWLLSAGWEADQVLQGAGLRVDGATGSGGRIPDLSVCSAVRSSGWLDVHDLVVVVEIISPASKSMDAETKRREYAAAGIPRYWLVERDEAHTVTLFRLTASGSYAIAAQVPLAWLLRTDPAEQLS